MKIDVLQAIHFTVAAWRQVSQPTVVNCFRKGGYGCALRAEADAKVTVDEEEDNDGFHEDWIRFGAVKDVIEFGDYASADSKLTTRGIDTTDDLCDEREGSVSGEEGKEDECEPEAVPSFAEAHAALVKVKAFFYAHNISERDEENILNMERALFGLRFDITVVHQRLFLVKRRNSETGFMSIILCMPKRKMHYFNFFSHF
jgi:hypothetical protein